MTTGNPYRQDAPEHREWEMKQRGAEAYQCGARRNENPHDPSSPEHYYWDRGWGDALGCYRASYAYLDYTEGA